MNSVSDNANLRLGAAGEGQPSDQPIPAISTLGDNPAAGLSLACQFVLATTTPTRGTL